MNTQDDNTQRPGPSPSGSFPFEAVRRTAATVSSRATWPQRLIGLLILIMLIGLAGVLIVWGLIVAAVIAAIGAVLFAIGWVRRWWLSRDESGLRRNVRIVRRD